MCNDRLLGSDVQGFWFGGRRTETIKINIFEP